MLSQRVPLLLTFSAILLLTSIALRDWRPSILILPLASLFMVANALSPRNQLNLEFRRRLTQDRAVTGETASVGLEVTNKGREKVDFLEIYDRLPEQLLLTEGTNHLIISLKAGERQEFNYNFLCSRRGKYEIGPIHLRTRDALGFSFEEATKPVTSLFLVSPQIDRLNSSDLPFKRTGQLPGIIHSSQRGSGTEFYGLRNHSPEDELRRVAWKASARMGRLMTIENESERSTNIVIIVDANSTSDSEMFQALLEDCIKAAGSLSSLLLNLGNQVSLISYCRDRVWLPGGFGKRHFRKILDHLTRIEVGETPLPIGFELPYLFISKPQVVLVSPLLDSNIVRDVRNLASQGFSLFIISPSLTEMLTDQKDEASRIALRIFDIERRDIITELRQYGVVMDWNRELPLRTAIREVRRWNVQTGH